VISGLSDTQIQNIIKCFPQKADNTDEMIGVTNCNTHVTESFKVSISTTPIPSSHDSNSSGVFKGIGPGNSSKAEVSISHSTILGNFLLMNKAM
jgi:hypothetical protein